MSSPMNTLLLGLTMYDTCLIITSVLMVGIPSINNYHLHMIDLEESEEVPVFNLYMSSIFPFIMPILYPVREGVPKINELYFTFILFFLV